MNLRLRRGGAADAASIGDICYRAFKAIADEHNFAADFPDPAGAVSFLGTLIAHDRFYDVIAEDDGAVAGSNFLDERNPISGIGPITIDPDRQNGRIGRALMQAVLERSAGQGFLGVRLVQAAYHYRSLALYLKLGFVAREMLVCLQGPAIGQALPGYSVRRATIADATSCNQLCLRVHGHDRNGELADCIADGSGVIVERAGRITGYATAVAFFGHAVAETNDDLKALIGAAQSFGGPGFLVPAANGELLRWCLDSGLRVRQTMTLMSMGVYQAPEGAWLPSVLF